MLKIKKFTVNPLQENSYVLSDETGNCVFVDPGFYFEEEYEEVRSYVAENRLTPVMIANTHCHFDHIFGVEALRKEYNIPFLAHRDDEFWLEQAVEQGKMFGFDLNAVKTLDSFFNDGEFLKFGNSQFEIIHIPGHSPGHVVFYAEVDEIVIAGDVLFYGSIGRTDLPRGNHELLISGIKSKLFSLPDDTKVFCGHGPETTLGFEKNNNPFLT
ncbi:MAG: MBL fold metallo-hydrolase [Mariniphaga sp.]|jgi:glyoxylase-like metal-dependent hydrolase (beta-lactamase superfamily II)|nr:MBL fold metallo-hydrolase [Mariniphaga sp.]